MTEEECIDWWTDRAVYMSKRNCELKEKINKLNYDIDCWMDRVDDVCKRNWELIKRNDVVMISNCKSRKEIDLLYYKNCELRCEVEELKKQQILKDDFMGDRIRLVCCEKAKQSIKDIAALKEKIDELEFENSDLAQENKELKGSNSVLRMHLGLLTIHPQP